MADRGISGYGFHHMQRPWRRTADQRPFDTAMLESEGNLQMEHLFAMALKTEMSRFDNTRMNRADSNFVHLVTLHTVKIHHRREQAAAIRFTPEPFPLAERFLETRRLEPGVPLRTHQTLLGNFPFKQVQLGTG